MVRRRVFEPIVGECIDATIRRAVVYAQELPAAVVGLKANINGVTVLVDADSDPRLLYREWYRMIFYSDPNGTVGPHPARENTYKELARDERMWRRSKLRNKLWRAQCEAEHIAKCKALADKLATLPPMIRNEDVWTENYLIQEEFGQILHDYAEGWARLVQAELAAGKKLDKVVEATSQEADIYGLSGYQISTARNLLLMPAFGWPHTPELFKWYQRQYPERFAA